jgi:exodeoxyribonuclease V alpha subunit
VAAIEQCLYDAMALGHTCLPIPEIRRRIAKRLSDRKSPDWKLADAAMLLTEGSPQQGCLPFRRIGDRMQANGMSIIEADIAERLLQMAAGEEGLGQTGLFSQVVVDADAVELFVDGYLAGGKYQLNAEQKQAVKACSVNHFSLILGGAGTGKTTVLDALYKSIIAQHPGIPIYQIALAGLASQRMQHATGLPAMTIASFLLNVDEGEIEIGSLVVVDESSMVDVLLFHRLLRHLPLGVRLILVGDHCQLPGIGPGVVLHALAGHSKFAQTHLTQVTRQSQASGIPQVAEAIRNHQIPKWDTYHAPAVASRPAPRLQHGLFDLGVSFIACPTGQINDTVVRVYEELGGCGHDHSVQLLSPLKDGPGGVNDLNFILHGKFHKKSREVMYENVQHGGVGFLTKKRLTLREGDLVMFGQNDYQLNLRNGTLGRVEKALPVGEPGAPCCTVSFDGREYDFTVEQAGNLVHAYALTVHKGQGNQFRRVVIPIRPSNLLDNSMIYTAVTRGVEQVVLVGDVDAAVAAILGPSNAMKRCVMLPTLLESNET